MKRLILTNFLLAAALAASAQFNPTNCSSHIINPSFECGLDGWKTNGMKTQTNNETKAGKTGNTYCEYWVEAPATLPDTYLQQTVKGLPDGQYNLTASCHAELQGSTTEATGVTLFAGDQSVAVTSTKKYTVPVTVSGGELTIGFRVSATNANWVTVDHFQLIKTDGGLKGTAKPLNRGLMAVCLSSSGSSGNLVSWRIRRTDPQGVQFKLYRGSSATEQTTALNSGKAITGKSNFRDSGGNASSYYRLEVLDANGNVVETMAGIKAWENQTMTVPTITPKDMRFSAAYAPNDASFCDMDGDGEYEIILKWDPNNSKDAASDGNTSNTYFDCYKLDGTRLWRIDQGPNIRSGAHTTPFIAWDLNGDGFGEFVLKTAPGTIDGNGNYVVIGNDDPLQNCLSGRGKPDKGPEYLTVFDGLTGEAISTIPYHTKYGDVSTDVWGDAKQNRSERYTACLAYLDGEDKNPSAIFNRGYYSGAFVGAYDFDGNQLKERWVSRNTSSGKGLWGEGAHWLTAADLDGDGKHEIQFGSAALDHDGSLLYRTGMKHGDAFHIGDFLTTRPGLEVFMCHEASPYGADLRDAKTGEIILRHTAGSDTGRGLAAHFDSSQKSAQFMHSATAQLLNCDGGTVNAESWAIGSSGAGINCRIYWDGDLFDEFFDKSVLAHWNPSSKAFDRIKFNNGNYLWGTLCNGTKYNPCVMGDMLGDWREEIVTYDANNNSLIICATNFESAYPMEHLMDDIQYRENVVSQNVGYNQPPHLSYDPAIKFGIFDISFKKDLDEGTYYMKHQDTGKYLLAGQSWGTRAILGTAGFDVKLTLVDDYTYTVDTKISNGSAKHFLSDAVEPYVDDAAASLSIKKSASAYTVHGANGFLTPDADGNLVYESLTRTRWQFLTREQMIANLKTSAEQAPADATFLIKNPNFGRNDQRYSEWKWSSDCTNKNNSGDETNFCVESWHSTFTFSQTLTDIPDGNYTLTAQGFYRPDEGGDTHAVLFAGDESTPLPAIDSEDATPNSMKDASAVFTAGLYNVEPIAFHVSGGTVTIGVRNTVSTTDWCIWDNFQLTYYGAKDPTAISHVAAEQTAASAIYTITGAKVSSITAPGIYIVNGKKIIVK